MPRSRQPTHPRSPRATPRHGIASANSSLYAVEAFPRESSYQQHASREVPANAVRSCPGVSGLRTADPLSWRGCPDLSAELDCIGETGFEPATARPPAGCATRLRHSPWQKQAGDGNRTRPRSLEGFCAATTLRPHAQDPILPACPARRARPEAEQAKPPPSEAPGPAKAQGATAATATATVAPPPGPRRHRPPALPGATGRTSCRGRRPVSPPSR